MQIEMEQKQELNLLDTVAYFNEQKRIIKYFYTTHAGYASNFSIWKNKEITDLELQQWTDKLIRIMVKYGNHNFEDENWNQVKVFRNSENNVIRALYFGDITIDYTIPLDNSINKYPEFRKYINSQ